MEEIAARPLDPKAEELQRAAGRKQAGEYSGFWAIFRALVDEFIEAPLPTVMRPVLSWMRRIILFVDELEADKTPEFWEMTAAMAEAYINVKVSPEQVRDAFFEKGRLGGMEALGASFFNLLAHDLSAKEGAAAAGDAEAKGGDGIGGLPKGTLTPEQGVAGARRFLGFLMSNALRDANVSVITEMLTLGQLEGFKRYGEAMGENLSLSRLARAGLGPLVETLLRDPLGWALNKEYRPTLLSKSELVRARAGGFISDAAMREEFARQGYSDEKIAALVEIGTRELSVAQLEVLRVFGLVGETEYKAALSRLGYTPERVEQFIRAEDRAEARSTSLSIARRVAGLYEDGIISAPIMTETLGRFALLPFEREALATAANEFRTLPRRMPSKAELEEALTAGTLSRADYEDYLVRMGYDEEGRRLLLGTPRKRLSRADMREALLHNTVDIGEYRDFLREEGYSEDSVSILVIEGLRDKTDFDAAEKEKARRKAEKEAKAKAAQTPAP